MPDEAKATHYAVEADTLKRYTEYRRAQITAEFEAVTNGPFSTGNVSRSEGLRALNIVLCEFENLSAWFANGQPGVKAVLSEGQKEHYRWAVSQGFPVDDEIKKEL